MAPPPPTKIRPRSVFLLSDPPVAAQLVLPKCNIQTNALCLGGGGGLLHLSSIGNYNFLYVKEPSIISSQFIRLYICNLLEVYDGGKW